MGIPIGTGSNGPVYHPPIKPPPMYEPPYAAPQPAAVYQPGMATRLGPVIDQFLQAQGSPLAGLGRKFAKKGNKYGIDPRLLVAITGAESSFGKYLSGAHNPFGMGPGIDYNSWADAIGAAAKNLNQNYFGEGRNTIPEIARKWAPVGAGNDPTNLNHNWVNNVTTYYQKLSGMHSTPPPLAGLSELFYKQALWNNRSQWFTDPALTAAHETHIHEAATNPRVLLKSLRVGQNRFGLTPGENPYTGNPADPGVHVSDSYHYRNFPGKFGPDNQLLGEAIDWTGNANDLSHFYSWLAQKFVGRGSYDYGTRGVAGGSAPVTGQATPQQVSNQQQQTDAANQMSANLMAAAMSPAGAAGRRRRKDQDVVAQLLQQLGYQGGYM